MNVGLPSAGRGRLARHGRPGQGATHLRTAINTPGIAPPCGDRNEFRSTLRWTRASRATRQTWTGGNASENRDKHSCAVGSDRVGRGTGGNASENRDKHSRNRPPAATEMNFGLPSAGRGRLVQHGRPGQGATHLRTAIILNPHHHLAETGNVGEKTFRRAPFPRVVPAVGGSGASPTTTRSVVDSSASPRDAT
jgi:hypothetical protein